MARSLLALTLAIAFACVLVVTLGGEDTPRAQGSKLIQRSAPAGPPSDSGGRVTGLAAVTRRTADAQRVAADGNSPAHDGTSPTARVEGSIVLSAGVRGAEDIEVLAWPADGAAAPVAARVDAAARRYAFDALPLGDVRITARARRGPSQAWGTAEVRALSEAETREAPALFLVEYVIEGVALDQDGVPIVGLPIDVDGIGSVQGAWATLRGFDEEHEGTGTLRAEYDGAVEVVDVASLGLDTVGGHRVTFEPLGEDASGTGTDLQERALIEAALEAAARQITEDTVRELTSGAQLTAIDDIQIVGGLVEGEGISWEIDVSNGWIEPPSFATAGVTATVTDSSGAFRVWLPGPADVQVTAPGGDRSALPRRLRFRPERADASATPDAPRARVDFELVLAASLEGVATAPVHGGDTSVMVFLRHTTSSDTSMETADARGAYRRDDLTPGHYLIYARSGGDEGRDFSAHVEIELAPGEDRVLPLLLQPSGEVTGVVTDAAGLPLGGTPVALRGANNDRLRRSGRTEADGSFRIPGLYAATYEVLVADTPVEGLRVHVPQGSTRDLGVLTYSAAAGDE